MGKNLIEEKALGYNNSFNNDNYSHKRIDSLEEKVGVFLDQDFDISDPNFDGDDESLDFDNHSMERTLFWESQKALLQEVLERYSITGSKLREEMKRIIEEAKETVICSCFKPNSNGCIACLRQNVVRLLSQRGFNATLCTSIWKHTKKFPGGKHYYIEVIVSTIGRKKQIPFLIELELKEQFEMAKACDEYRKLIAQLPKYYIGKADYLNAIVGIVCNSAKRSMKEKKLHMGPWRKRSFMQMKWSSSSMPMLHSSSEFSLLSTTHFSAAPTVSVI